MRQWSLRFFTTILNFQFSKFIPLKLGLLFVVAMMLTLAISNGNAVAEMLFQSPQSPTEPPAASPPEEAQPNQEPVTEQTQPVQQQTETQPAVDQNNAQPSTSESVPAPALRQPRRQSDTEAEDETPKSSNFILDRGELVDTVVVSTAYVWLCCGIILILIIPLVFLFLHILGRSKIIKEDIP